MIRIGIIGCGKITEVRHAPEYYENPNCQITAYFNRTPQRAQALADRYGGQVYPSVEALLESDVDAVSICTANQAHGKVAVQALKAGKHVLCEKPMAVTLEECEAMVAAARESGKYLMIAQNQRFDPVHKKAREVLQSGVLGTLLTFETHYLHAGPENWTGVANTWFFDKKSAQFGVMADLGVHKTDLLYYLTGQRIVKTMAVLTTVDKRYPDGGLIGVDDNAFAIYTLENGVRGTMHVGWTNYGGENCVTKFYGKQGVLRIYDDRQYPLILEKSDGTMTAWTAEELTAGQLNSGVIDTFIDCIRTGQPPEVSGESAMHAMKTIFANQRSAESGREEAVE